MNFAHITKPFHQRPLVLVAIAALAIAAGATSAYAREDGGTKKAAQVVQADPLAGDTWHAMAPSWPGTIRFDGKAKKMVLEPLGSAVIEGTYTVADVKKAGAVTQGKLRMVNTAGSVSESTFEITGKDMKLTFATGQPPETYQRLTVSEAEAEKARLQKAIKEGRTNMINGIQSK